MIKQKIDNARHCEGERRVKLLFALQTVFRLLLEPEQRAHFDQTFQKFASKMQPVEALRK